MLSNYLLCTCSSPCTLAHFPKQLYFFSSIFSVLFSFCLPNLLSFPFSPFHNEISTLSPYFKNSFFHFIFFFFFILCLSSSFFFPSHEGVHLPAQRPRIISFNLPKLSKKKKKKIGNIQIEKKIKSTKITKPDTSDKKNFYLPIPFSSFLSFFPFLSRALADISIHTAEEYRCILSLKTRFVICTLPERTRQSFGEPRTLDRHRDRINARVDRPESRIEAHPASEATGPGPDIRWLRALTCQRRGSSGERLMGRVNSESGDG